MTAQHFPHPYLIGLRFTLDKLGEAEQDPWRAKSALQCMMVSEGLLQGAQRCPCFGQSVYRLDATPIGLYR